MSFIPEANTPMIRVVTRLSIQLLPWWAFISIGVCISRIHLERYSQTPLFMIYETLQESLVH